MTTDYKAMEVELANLVNNSSSFSFMISKEDETDDEVTEANAVLQQILDRKDISTLSTGEDGLEDLPGFVPSYIQAVVRLDEENLEDIIEGHTAGWIVRFIQSLISDIMTKTKDSYKYIDGRCVKASNNSAKNTISTINRTVNTKKAATKDLFMKVVKRVVETETESTPLSYVEEEHVKMDLLNMTQDDLDEMFAVSADTEIVNWMKYDNKEKATEIISTAREISKENILSEVIKQDSDWSNWMEEREDDFSINDEDDILMKELMKELEEEDIQIENTKKEKRASDKKEGNKKGGLKTQSIKVLNKETGETKEYASKGDCMKDLNTSFATFVKFQKGESKLNKIYEIVK